MYSIIYANRSWCSLISENNCGCNVRMFRDNQTALKNKPIVETDALGK